MAERWPTEILKIKMKNPLGCQFSHKFSTFAGKIKQGNPGGEKNIRTELSSLLGLKISAGLNFPEFPDR